MSISPSPWSRQRGSRYAIRAGRNLPDKEFRYLRTVIVTAAVYRGFDSPLRRSLRLLLTFRHRAGVRPYTSAHAFAESCVFSKQSLPPLCCNPTQLRPRGHHHLRHTLSRSYSVNLPNSLTRVLSSALVFSTCPPESVCGTVTSPSSQSAAFLGSVGSNTSARRPSPSPLGVVVAFSSYDDRLLAWTRIQRRDVLPFFVPALLLTGGSGLLTGFPSATPLGCTLGAD